MKILFIGDIVGSGARDFVKAQVPVLREEYGLDFCVANGENMAAGNGFSKSCMRDLEGCGVDVFTGGDHSWDQKDFVKDIELFTNVLRPANVSERQPGRGYGVFQNAAGMKLGVVNLLGRTFMNNMASCPFVAADNIVRELSKITPFIIVDFHAEATSDKIALGHFLDGRVSGVFGTHTHVPTADEQIFPGGTGFQCDTGMVGSRESVLGREIAPIIGRYLSGMPVRFPVVTSSIRLNGTLLSTDDNGRAVSIERIVRDGE